MEGVIAPTVLSGNCVCTSLSNCDFVQGAVQGGVACACTSHKDRNKTRTMQSKSLMGCASSAATAARPRSPYSAIPAAQCRRGPAVRTLQCRNGQSRSRTSRYAIAHDHIRSQERKHVHRVGCVVHHDDIERTIKVGRWPDRRDRWQSHPVPDRRNRRHERYTRTQLIGCCLRAGCRCRNALLRRYSRNANLEDLPVVLADTTTDDQSRRRRGQGRKCKDHPASCRIEKALHHLTLAKGGRAGSAARPKSGSLKTTIRLRTQAQRWPDPHSANQSRSIPRRAEHPPPPSVIGQEDEAPQSHPSPSRIGHLPPRCCYMSG